MQLEFRFLIWGVGWEVVFFDNGFYINTFDPNDVPTLKLMFHPPVEDEFSIDNGHVPMSC